MTSSKVPLLLYIGSPLLDISAKVSEEVLRRYNLKPDDCIRATDEHAPLFQDLFTTPGAHITAGGSLQNSARISKWVLGDKGRVALAGCTGKDEYAVWLDKKLRKEGVEPIYITLDGVETGVCACLLSPGGERSMCVRQKAAARFEPGHLEEPILSNLLNEADCIFISGYFLGHSPKVVDALADRCGQNQLSALTLAAAYICRDYSSAIQRTMLTVDLVIGNEDEARELTKSCGGDHTLTCEEIARFLVNLPRTKSRGQRIVIISRGPDPVIAIRGGPDVRSEVLIIPVDQDIVLVDGVGCGDALAGGLLAVYALTRDLEKAVRAGIRAASRIAGVTGCDRPEDPFGEFS